MAKSAIAHRPPTLSTTRLRRGRQPRTEGRGSRPGRLRCLSDHAPAKPTKSTRVCSTMARRHWHSP
eukprot:14493548-Alexandrium_andersonii.AAC.1